MKINPDVENAKLMRNIIEGEIKDIERNWPFYYGGPKMERPYPFHYHWFHNFRWYRRWSGGIWHLFQLETNYFTWRKMTRKFPSSSLIQIEEWS